MAVTKELSPSHALGLFLHGLCDDIRLRIRSKDANDICQTMHLTREIEQEVAASRDSRIGAKGRRPGACNRRSPHDPGDRPNRSGMRPLSAGPQQEQQHEHIWS
ncbi:hypothetical protein ACS0TY_034257 [Phlomoides rotata]